MDNFIVSARKYRPQNFYSVVGQKSITQTLKNAIRNNQVAQAFLFCGPRGVGKTTCARILAKTINCENLSPDAEACNTCPSCKSFNDSASFNITELDGASNNSVDEIRNLVDKVRIPPQAGRFKVYIIDEVHMLSLSAFNAFLKTLEEPPSYAKFILATTEKHKIIPTILSRCQIFDFRRITVDDIVHHLQYVAEHEGVETEENALHIIAQKADGAMRDALSIFDQLVSFAGDKLTYEAVLENLNVLDYEYYFRITDQILAGDISSTLLTIDEILDKGFEGQHFLIGYGSHLRNLLVCKDQATAGLLETAPAIRERYIQQSAQCDPGFLLKLLDINNKCDLNYKVSNNKRLHLELALMQMCQVNMVQEPATVLKSPAVSYRKEPPAVKKTESRSVPQPAPEPVQKPKEGKSYGGTISIKAAKDTKEKKEDSTVAEQNGDKYKTASPFSQEQLESAWDQYSETLQPGSPHLYSTLRKYRPVLKEDFFIEFCVDNKLLEDELNNIKSALMEFLWKALDNYTITLQTIIPAVPRGTKPYTNREKFSRMAEKNPSLLDLREQLDLDVE